MRGRPAGAGPARVRAAIDLGLRTADDVLRALADERGGWPDHDIQHFRQACLWLGFLPWAGVLDVLRRRARQALLAFPPEAPDA
jgi:hypothetical protein